MLAKTRPDFVIALGRHSEMAATAHFLLDEGYPFLIEKPAGLNAREVRGVADKAASKAAFAAVPLFHRFQPFVLHAKRMLAEGAFGPVSHFYFRSNRPSSARYVAWGAPWMLAGRDALLVQRDASLRCTTSAGEQDLTGTPAEPLPALPALAVRDALARWKNGEPPAAGVEDCYRAMRLVDEAYAIGTRY